MKNDITARINSIDAEIQAIENKMTAIDAKPNSQVTPMDRSQYSMYVVSHFRLTAERNFLQEFIAKHLS